MPSLRLPPVDRVPGAPAIARLSRRVRTLLLAAVLFVIVFVLLFTLPVPYVILSPGPTYNTLGKDDGGRSIISISGRSTRATSGNLNMTTVGVGGDSITPFEALRGWLAGDESVVPRTAVYPPNATQKQTDAKNTQDFVVSQDSAKVAALCELGYPRAFGVVSVVAKGPSSGKLRTGDQFRTVAGKPAATEKALRAVLDAQTPGRTVPVTVKRGSSTASAQVTLGPPPEGQKGAALGVTVADTCLAPFTIDLGLANEIGGPSAGLMFALGIMDKIGPTDLTKGRFIAGTGTIDATGKVGPIGGIQLKMIAARRKGASVFLAPAGNCGDVRGATPSGLKVIRVDTLHDAVQDLEKIEKGQSVPGC